MIPSTMGIVFIRPVHGIAVLECLLVPNGFLRLKSIERNIGCLNGLRNFRFSLII